MIAYLQLTDTSISLTLNNISLRYWGPPHKGCPWASTCLNLASWRGQKAKLTKLQRVAAQICQLHCFRCSWDKIVTQWPEVKKPIQQSKPLRSKHCAVFTDCYLKELIPTPLRPYQPNFKQLTVQI